MRTLWSARNEVIAEWLGDPTDAQRRAWMATLAEQGALPEDLVKSLIHVFLALPRLADCTFLVGSSLGRAPAAR